MEVTAESSCPPQYPQENHAEPKPQKALGEEVIELSNMLDSLKAFEGELKIITEREKFLNALLKEGGKKYAAQELKTLLRQTYKKFYGHDLDDRKLELTVKIKKLEKTTRTAKQELEGRWVQNWRNVSF